MHDRQILNPNVWINNRMDVQIPVLCGLLEKKCECGWRLHGFPAQVVKPVTHDFL